MKLKKKILTLIQMFLILGTLIIPYSDVRSTAANHQIVTITITEMYTSSCPYDECFIYFELKEEHASINDDYLSKQPLSPDLYLQVVEGEIFVINKTLLTYEHHKRVQIEIPVVPERKEVDRPQLLDTIPLNVTESKNEIYQSDISNPEVFLNMSISISDLDEPRGFGTMLIFGVILPFLILWTIYQWRKLNAQQSLNNSY